MLLGHSGARGCDGFTNTGLVRGDDIHVSLNDDDKTGLANEFFGLGETEDKATFIKEEGFWSIKVFRLAVTNNASGEADNVAGVIKKWYHHATAEEVAIELIEETGIAEFGSGVAFRFEGANEMILAVRGVADAKINNGFFIKITLIENIFTDRRIFSETNLIVFCGKFESGFYTTFFSSKFTVVCAKLL